MNLEDLKEVINGHIEELEQLISEHLEQKGDKSSDCQLARLKNELQGVEHAVSGITEDDLKEEFKSSEGPR